jgi:hypothetical protein
VAVVTLYRVLGGGWDVPVEEWSGPVAVSDVVP